MNDSVRINDMLSVCATRHLYEFGCRNCVYLDKCLNYQNNNNGLKPYETNIQRDNNTSKEKEENGGF